MVFIGTVYVIIASLLEEQFVYGNLDYLGVRLIQ